MPELPGAQRSGTGFPHFRTETKKPLAGSSGQIRRYCQLLNGVIQPGQQSGFGKIALQRADLKVPVPIGTDTLGRRYGA